MHFSRSSVLGLAVWFLIGAASAQGCFYGRGLFSIDLGVHDLSAPGREAIARVQAKYHLRHGATSLEDTRFQFVAGGSSRGSAVMPEIQPLGTPALGPTVLTTMDAMADSAPPSPAPKYYEERLFLKAEAAIVYAIGAVNPDAAAQLYALSLISGRGSPALPMVGDSGSTKLQTLASLIELLRDESSLNIAGLMKNLPSNADISLVKYAVIKRLDGGATLQISHRLLSRSNIEVGTPYPDISVDLTWQVSGRTGYWQATTWKAQ